MPPTPTDSEGIAPTSALPISLYDLLYFRGVEAARVEFKSRWNEGPVAQQVLQTICAFANDYYNVNGGYIVLGVEEQDGVARWPPLGLNPVGLEKIQKWIRGHCNRLEPIFQPLLAHEVVEGRHLLVIWAHGSSLRPHSTPGERAGDRRFWVRQGAETVEARGSVLTELLQMTRWVPFDDQPASSFSVNDLRSTLVREFLQDLGSALVDEPDDREMYRALQLVYRINSHEVPRNVGLLFFSDRPERIFPGARIDVVRFKDDAGGDILEEHIFRGPLHRQVRDCLGYLRNLTTQFVRKHPDRPEASTWSAWPAAAIEEAVVNAVHHRDYRAEQPTKIYLYPKELVVTSYPGPVSGLKIEHFASGRRIPQVPARNRRIGELLKELKLAETRSTGVPKIFRAMAANGSPEPQFEFDEGRTYFTVALPIHPESLGLEASAPSRDPILQRYLERLREACRYLPIAGFETRVRLPLQLEDVYIPLRARMQSLEGDESSLSPEGDRDLPLDQVFPIAQQKGFRGIVILGNPGSGKTTLLKHFVLACTDPNQGTESIGLPAETVPVLIELRRMSDPKAGLLISLAEAVGQADIALGGEALEFARNLSARDRLLILVDGLDELADSEQRAEVSRWLEMALSQLPRSFFVITSRYAGYRGDSRLDGRFLEFHVRDLDSEESERFITAWYRAVESQVEVGRLPEVAERLAAKSAAELAAQIYAHSRLRELAANPLLLQILCLVHRYRRSLPERRVALYEECIKVLLQTWPQAKNLPLTVSAYPARQLLLPIAWWLQTSGRRDGSLEEILTILPETLQELGQAGKGEQLLLAIRDQSGLLVTLGPGRLGFLHQSFQDYLCARYVQERATAEPALLRKLAGHFGEPWWREVLLLALGLESPSLFEPLIAELLRQEQLHRDPVLADDCLRDAASPSARPFLAALQKKKLQSPEERYHALRLLRSLPGWQEIELKGLSGRQIVEVLKEDPDAQVRGIARELLADSQGISSLG